jgi:O-methyltransferase involved in polyketide biosynthesis
MPGRRASGRREHDTVDAFDTTRPNIARVYDYWLGGKDNFVADRELAAAMTEVNPGIPAMARANRKFVVAAVGKAAKAGIRQFVDLGAGLPTHPAVHEAARALNPDARVLYLDNDPVVVTHARALLATTPGIYAVEADITRPDEVLAHPAVGAAVDWTEPVAVVLAAILHFRDAASAGRLVAAYTDAACAGSYLRSACSAARTMTWRRAAVPPTRPRHSGYTPPRMSAGGWTASRCCHQGSARRDGGCPAWVVPPNAAAGH